MNQDLNSEIEKFINRKKDIQNVVTGLKFSAAFNDLKLSNFLQEGNRKSSI